MKLKWGAKAVRTIYGTRFTIRWADAVKRLKITDAELGVETDLVVGVFVRDKNKAEVSVIAQKTGKVTIPKPLDTSKFVFELESEDKITSTTTKFPGKVTITDSNASEFEQT